MNILMLTGYFAPRLGGVEKHVLRISEELTRMGHRVTVLTRQWESNWPADEDLRGIRVRRVRGGIAKAMTDRQTDLLREADAVHCHDLYPYLRFVAPAWPEPRAPVFVTFHGYEGYPIPRTARWLRRRLAARVACVICMGEFICRWYGHMCAAVSYGGVDAPMERVPDAAPDAPALYVGRLAPDTGIMAYLEALRLLRQRGHRVPLVICGDGSLRDAVRRFASNADIEVRLQGWVQDVSPHLRECRFAFVSGYLTTLEAMVHRRLACSLYDNPLKHDYLDLFPAADKMIIADGASGLADAIERPIADHNATASMIDAAEVFAREQTWEKVARLYLDLYRQQGLAT